MNTSLPAFSQGFSEPEERGKYAFPVNPTGFPTSGCQLPSGGAISPSRAHLKVSCYALDLLSPPKVMLKLSPNVAMLVSGT